MPKELVNCKSCEKEVSPTAKTCPHCGETDPGVNAAKGCLVILIIGVIVGLIAAFLTISDDSSQTNNSTTQIEQSDKWYQGGTLHKASIADWKEATYENKLATCADFVYSTSPKIKELVTQSGNPDTAKEYAAALIICIDKAHENDDTSDTMKAAESAVLCMTIMDWM